MDPLPYDIVQDMIQCFGRSFHYKDNLAAFFISSGVSKALVDRHREQVKFVWGRNLLNDLSQSEEGRLIQRRILTELCKLRNLPDKDVPDRDAGLDALRALKAHALKQKLYVEEKQREFRSELQDEAAKAEIIRERGSRLESLRSKFLSEATGKDRQAAGYSLEDLLKDLFALFKIEYRKSYRTETQQIDGHFRFEGFDYLVEAKWRANRPTEQEVGGFKQKVDTKIESTRGLFVSVPGYRAEVIEQFSRRGGNIILMDGTHLILILEGRLDLRDALRSMIAHAAQEGSAYTPVSDL